MDNNDERDYSEEAYNRLTCPNCDGQHESGVPCKTVIADENRESVAWWNFGHPSDLLTNYRTMDESAQEVEDRADPVIEVIWDSLDETPLPVGYGDEWDGSARNQSNDFFIGHSGHVTVLWHVTNNPFEKYDSSKSYHTPALDGSALYVWASLHMTDSDAIRSFEATRDIHRNMGVKPISYPNSL